MYSVVLMRAMTLIVYVCECVRMWLFELALVVFLLFSHACKDAKGNLGLVRALGIWM